MKIYDYSEVTGEFMRAREARQDPVIAGRYLIPALATTTPPPQTGDKEIAVYSEETSSWSVKSDYRNAAVWLKKDSAESGRFTDIGKLPNYLTDKKPLEQEGMKAVWSASNDGWVLKEDFTNRPVWEKSTGRETRVVEPGPLPADITSQSPESFELPLWSVDGWVEDLSKARALKKEEIGISVEKLLTTTVISVGDTKYQIDPYLLTTITTDIQSREMLGEDSVDLETADGDWLTYSIDEARTILSALVAAGTEIRRKRAIAIKAIKQASNLQQIKEVVL